jgi:hypothetical protein
MTSSISVGYFSPSSLTGCVLWLDGSSLGLSNGATVSTWSSLGPVSYTTTSTSGRFPTYASNVQNGRGAVQYATGQTSILSNFALPATQSLFLLYYPINTSAGSPFIEQSPDVNGNDGFFIHAQTNNNYAIRNGGALATVNFGTIAQSNTWQMIEGINKDTNAGTTMSFYSNATLIASNGVQNGTATITNTLFINGRNNTNTLSYPAYIAEFIVYSNALNNFGRQQIEGYLAWKWGLTSLLPSTHPYKTLPYFILTEQIPRSIPDSTYILPINTFSTIKTFTLPTVSTNAGRMLILKDYLGYAGSNNIRLSTLGLDRIERSNVSSMTLSNTYGAWTFMNDGLTNWFLTNAYLNSLGIVQPQPPPPPFSNFLWSQFRNMTQSDPSFNAGGTGWGAAIGTPGAYNPINFQDGDSRIGQSDQVGIVSKGFFFSSSNTTVQFRIVVDDGGYVWFNNVGVITNAWRLQGDTAYTSGTLSVTAGYTPFQYNFYEWAGGFTSELYYSIAGGAFTADGTGRFFHNDTSKVYP